MGAAGPHTVVGPAPCLRPARDHSTLDRMRLVLPSSLAALVILGCATASTPGSPGGSADAGVARPDAARDAAVEAPVADGTAHDGSPGRVDVTARDAGEAREASTTTDAAGGTLQSLYMTFYGWEDNSPPGGAIAYGKGDGFPTVHSVAGGTGTYADPITFASDKAEIPVGTLVYSSFLEKYLVMEDDCGECDTDWSTSGAWHIDVWMNSDGTESPASLAACEDAWTQAATTVELGPPPGRTVTTAPLFVPATDACRTSP